jgi:hypothetical protein
MGDPTLIYKVQQILMNFGLSEKSSYMAVEQIKLLGVEI